MKNKISVVIPTYNSSKTIKSCLERLYISIEDYGKNVEVVVVDDFSKDDSAGIAKKFPCRVIKLKKKEANTGPAKPRNIGAKATKGDIILFIDSDVLLEESAINLVAKNFENKDVIAVCGIYSKEPANKSWFNWYIAIQKYFLWTKVKDDKYSGFGTRLGAIRKEVFEEIGGFNPKFKEMEDYEFGRRIAERHKVVLDKEIQGKHHNPSLKTCMKKYFERTHYWFRLFLRKKKFDNILTTASMGAITMFGFFSIFLFLLSLLSLFFLKKAVLLMFGLAILTAAVFILGNIGFFIFCLKEKGLFFMVYSLFISYILSLAIGGGLAYSMITYPLEKIKEGG